MRVNELKRKLAGGEIVVGSFVYIPSARFAEILGLIGFDFVVIDMEHGPIANRPWSRDELVGDWPRIA